MTAVDESTAPVNAGDAALLVQRYGAEPESAPELSDVIRHQLAHRSVRAFGPEPVSDAALDAIVAAAQSAPTSSNLQTWSLVVVRDPELKSRLASLSGDQEFIRQAPVFLVWLVDFARLAQLADRHDHALDGADYTESAIVGFVDVSLAAQNASLAAESLGLGTVFVGGARNHPEELAAELHLPDRVVAAFGLAVGHPDEADTARVKPRLPQPAVVHHERYREDTQLPAVDDYEKTIRAFYEDEGLAHSWIERVLARIGTVRGLNGRERNREALRNRGFELR
ncbi:NADPH-dependent oxidoreductase [Rhodococcus sp. NPDC003318]|uniref:NADPH-dependent oxidoreductase n=1 Tax=Rhodococcus sp. NPDC003318 TaxID=3364503 RepID=UPI0036BD6ED2